MSKESDFQDILENGINFGRGGSAKQKAKYREQRANRHK